MLTQGHLDPAAQDCIQSVFGYPQGWWLCNPLRAPAKKRRNSHKEERPKHTWASQHLKTDTDPGGQWLFEEWLFEEQSLLCQTTLTDPIHIHTTTQPTLKGRDLVSTHIWTKKVRTCRHDGIRAGLASHLTETHNLTSCSIKHLWFSVKSRYLVQENQCN